MRELTHLALLLPGFVFFWTLLRVDPVPKAYSYGVSLWITFAEVIGDAFLGLAVIASSTLIGARYYHALARPWGPSLQTDQILGGGVLWILGDLVGLPFLIAQLIQFIREDEAEAKVIDAELDARDAAAPPGPPAQQGPPGPQTPRRSAARGRGGRRVSGGQRAGRITHTGRTGARGLRARQGSGEPPGTARPGSQGRLRDLRDRPDLQARPDLPARPVPRAGPPVVGIRPALQRPVQRSLTARHEYGTLTPRIDSASN